ncbi:MAG: hypothetical protein IKB99_07090, partial [Lentisphaeria bacterium]|nr:hypothetical protein [Lentisphaeria bacterium]
KELKVNVVPVYMNIDTENNFPRKKQPVNEGNGAKVFRASNGVHPVKAGYDQMGDTLYCYLKALLSRKK